LLLIGGKDVNKKPIADIWIYNILQNRWSSVKFDDRILFTLPLQSYYSEDTFYIIFSNSERNKVNLITFELAKTLLVKNNLEENLEERNNMNDKKDKNNSKNKLKILENEEGEEEVVVV